jgi:hypothetical protein
MSYPDPIDLSGLNTYSLFDRPSKVSVSDFATPPSAGMTLGKFLGCLPNQLVAADLKKLAAATAEAVRNSRKVLVTMGAHVLKVGLSPVLIDLMERGIISGIGVNGACIIHDSEIAMAGKTSEDVGAVLGDGGFGAARETGEFLNTAIREAAESGKGLGQRVGEKLLEEGFPYNNVSLLAQAARMDIPVTVHVAVGTDIIHIHPSADGQATGKASHHDFRIFASLVRELDRGVLLNIGSAVIMPEVFLKALTLVRNLGYKVTRLTTANFDFIRQYRPLTNVVNRPTMDGGAGYNITGHHEIMIPLLAAAVLEALKE